MEELTAKDSTRRLGITLDATYRLIYAGKLVARKVDGCWLIPTEAIEARIKAREVRKHGTAAGR